MSSFDRIRSVVAKVAGVPNLGQHICFFGGAMPYIMCEQNSNREHSDIDVLVDTEYMSIVRDYLQANDLYRPELDSMTMNLDRDYGVKAFINGVYVEFEPFILKDGVFTRASFNPDKRLAGEEYLSYVDSSDIMVPINIDGVMTFSETLELIKAEKNKYRREKDLKDMDFIDQQGINTDKYYRVVNSISKATSVIKSFEEISKDGVVKSE